jgi:hypothetical protein
MNFEHLQKKMLWILSNVSGEMLRGKIDCEYKEWMWANIHSMQENSGKAL